MKFVALKSFISSLGAFNVQEEYDVKLDKQTSKMWVENGLIEEVKVGDTTNENQ